MAGRYRSVPTLLDGKHRLLKCVRGTSGQRIVPQRSAQQHWWQPHSWTINYVTTMSRNDIVGAEYVCEHNEEGPHVESTDVEEEAQHENNVELGGYVSASSVEATSRFMAAMLLSTMGRHDQALQQLHDL
jgi:hypothetical protein